MCFLTQGNIGILDSKKCLSMCEQASAGEFDSAENESLIMRPCIGRAHESQSREGMPIYGMENMPARKSRDNDLGYGRGFVWRIGNRMCVLA
jgi:hypothetical protein